MSSSGAQKLEPVTAYLPQGTTLYRSSAPNYKGSDSTQNMDAAAVSFLTQKGIKGVVSFNQHPYSDQGKALLSSAGIAFIHLPVVDFTAPTRDQLKDVHDFLLSKKTMLVHCGFGHGRTGTGVTAVQLYVTKGAQPPEEQWNRVNHVEKDLQMQVLRELRDDLQKSG